MESSLKQRLLSILERAPRSLPVCSDKASQQADVCCGSCHDFFAWNSVVFTPKSGVFMCASCQTATAETDVRKAWLSIVRYPVFYVILISAFALILYGFGWGRIAIDDLNRDDAEREPFRQKLGNFYLKQAQRVQTRIQLLETFGPAEQIPRWASLAGASMTNAKDAWNDESVAADLEAGVAVMLAKSGNTEDAYRQLLDLDSKIHEDSRQAYLFHRGGIALELEKWDRCKEDWEKVLEVVEKSAGIFGVIEQMVDNAIAAYSFDQSKEMWQKRVRAVAGMELPQNKMYTVITREFKEHNIRSDIAAVLEERIGAFMTEDDVAEDKNAPLVEAL